jgi:hypothetical protein
VSSIIPESYNARELIIIFSLLFVLLLICIYLFSLVILYNKILGLKGFSIKNIRNGIIENDISKVADKILFYQNRGKNINIIEQLEKDSIKNKKPYINPLFHFSVLKENSDLYFFLPDDMKITEENNEIIIYYKNLIYNVNRGKYIKQETHERLTHI